MKKKEIFKVVKAMKRLCASNEYCTTCVFYSSCVKFNNPCGWNKDEIMLITDNIKNIMDKEGEQNNERI